jgi:hypothetical protein
MIAPASRSRCTVGAVVSGRLSFAAGGNLARYRMKILDSDWDSFERPSESVAARR